MTSTLAADLEAAGATEPHGLLAFIAASPSPFHAVANAAGLLTRAGFAELDERDAWPGDPGRFYVQRGGALIAWDVPPSAEPTTGFHLIGAHTDSPNLRVKPRPDTGAAGWRQLGIEVYGGALVNSWLDRDLGLSGRVILRDGTARLVRVERPLLRVPQLAIHLDRDVNDRGLLLDKQQHLTPVWGLGAAREGDFVEFLAGELGVTSRDIVSHDVMLHDLTPPAFIGRDNELIACARLDNLQSSYCAIRALCGQATSNGDGTVVRRAGAGDAPRIRVVSLFDYEEVGSATATGAAGPFLETVLNRSITTRGGTGEAPARAFADSVCVSADMAHAVHPNYLERYEPRHWVELNRGPAIKINANARYATDGSSSAAFVLACERAGVPYQRFVSRNNMPCGSTIGPITATRLGISTVDVGCGQLSMHSARELAGAQDVAFLISALHAFL